MTSVSMTTVTDPSSVNTESAGVEDAESSQGGKPAQPEPGKDLTAEEEALLAASQLDSRFPAIVLIAWVNFAARAAAYSGAVTPAATRQLSGVIAAGAPE